MSDLIEKKRRARRRARKAKYDSMSYTTGDIGLNIDHFNKRMSTFGLGVDFSDIPTGDISGGEDCSSGAMGEGLKLKENWEDFNFKAYNSDDIVTVVIIDKRFDPLFKKDHKESLKRNNVRIEGHFFNGVVVTGKVSDIIQVCNECCVMNPTKIFTEALSLTEAKRYVRRYYIRPQNIFCSNKAEILKALIELDDANCSVYTLNNLGDEKDVSKLMNSDIIYYYDDGILYDKNRVKVMDYDLSIKKEENRKHFANVEKTSEREFKNAYEDRMTGVTELEENFFNLNFDDYNVFGEKLVEAKEAERCCICGEAVEGYGNNPEPFMSSNDGLNRCCNACNVKFVIPARLEIWEV
jgi:hypothetical protein